MDIEDLEPVHWRRDGTTSTTIRSLRAFGIGTFFAALALIVFARVFTLLSDTIGQAILVTVVVVVAVAVIVIAIGRSVYPGIIERLPASISESRFLRFGDALIATVLMAVVIVAFARGMGGGLGQMIATGLIPVALLALLIASFLDSVGTIDPEQRVIQLHEGETTIDLSHISDVSVRPIFDVAIVSLTYEQPDGRYIPGPRRFVAPPAAGRLIQVLCSADQD